MRLCHGSPPLVSDTAVHSAPSHKHPEPLAVADSAITDIVIAGTAITDTVIAGTAITDTAIAATAAVLARFLHLWSWSKSGHLRFLSCDRRVCLTVCAKVPAPLVLDHGLQHPPRLHRRPRRSGEPARPPLPPATPPPKSAVPGGWGWVGVRRCWNQAAQIGGAGVRVGSGSPPPPVPLRTHHPIPALPALDGPSLRER